MKELIENILSQKQVPLRPFTLNKLAGEASYREYFRLLFENGESLIIMKMPEGFSSKAEEITKSSKQFSELPFINVQKYLHSIEIPVPGIITFSEKNGIIILEDLGDKSLEQIFLLANNEMALFFYTKAIELLVDLQNKTNKNATQECIAFSRQFDEDLLNWEILHFVEYGVEDRLGKKMDESDRKRFLQIGNTLAHKIAQMPQGFVHRDFQSRNILINQYDLKLIDFQDALIGPVIYDLVALLRDSYVELRHDQVKKLQKAYSEKLTKPHPYNQRLEKLEYDFDLITIQRKLKDAGRFQYIKTVKKNPTFLSHVPTSLKYVKEALNRQDEFSEMGDLLKKYLSEFK